MKKYLNIFLFIALTAILGSCSKEEPFGDDTGTLRTTGLKVSIMNSDKTKAATTPDVNDFTVQILKDGTEDIVRSFRYGDMPEVVELPVGTYYARAFYGENPAAAFEAPYYKGETESPFSIKADEITELADPIVCKFANIKVTVYFDQALSAAMSADSKVVVNAGETGSSLEFTKAMEGTAGYFAYVDNSQTLTATFIGLVEDYQTTESKTYADVKPGNHYKITFKLHQADPDKGDGDLDLKVDATVITEDINVPIDPDDETIEDDMRPKEDDGDDQGGGDDKPTGPEIKAEPPVDLDKVNDVTADGLHCVLNITSTTGITGFVVDINSDKLTPAELGSIGLSDHLDLINPVKPASGDQPETDMTETLQGLGFPVKDQIENQKSVKFDITGFMGMLSMLGAGNHEFILKVSDSTGTTTKTLKLRTL